MIFFYLQKTPEQAFQASTPVLTYSRSVFFIVYPVQSNVEDNLPGLVLFLQIYTKDTRK